MLRWVGVVVWMTVAIMCIEAYNTCSNSYVCSSIGLAR